MDLQKIGNYITELRNRKGLTQEQLGEKIGVTNKTVSRWETGKYLPPAEMLLAMSELFSVSVNEILSGKSLSREEYTQKAEENLVSAVMASSFSLKDKINFYRKKWLKEHIAIICIAVVFVIAVTAVGLWCKAYKLAASAPLMLLFIYGLLNNSMMIYVEKKAFDETNK